MPSQTVGRCDRWLAVVVGLRRLLPRRFLLRGAAPFGVALWALAGGCQSKPDVTPPPVSSTTAEATVAELPRAFGFAEPDATSVPLARSLDAAGKVTAQLAVRANPGAHALVKVFIDGVESGALQPPEYRTTLSFERDGTRLVELRGYDATGATKATASLPVSVSGGCLGGLANAGVSFRNAPATKGIVDPVYLGPVVDGVTFRYRTANKPDAILVACEMVARVRRLATLVKSFGLNEVVHIGTYNYRQMRNPECEKANNCKLSQHSYGTALDIHGIGKVGSKVNYSTLKDWVVSKLPTCPGSPKSEADRVLHEFACQMRTKSLFSIILTPNYNATHRDHFHVDLTPNSATIKGELEVDPATTEVWDE
jgi:hypothetical protein